MTTLNLQVGASGDDGNFSISGGTTFQTTSTVTSVGNISGTTYGSWFRFTGVSGLAGKTILSASLQVYLNGSFGTPLTQVRAERANAPANPTSRADAIGRTRTTAKVDWDNPSGSGYTAKDITSVIQELADNHDPSAILVFWEDDGGASGAWNQGRSWDNGGSGAYAAKLDIVYVVVIAAGAPADIQFEGTVSTYVTVTPIVAGAPADIQFGGFPSTFTMQVQVGAPGDVQFEGTVSTYTMQVAAGAPVDIQFTGTVSTYIIVTPMAAGAPADITWQGFTSTIATVDMVVEVSLSNLSGDTDEECGVVFRLGNATNFLAAYVDDGDNLVHLSAFEGGVERSIATAAWTPADTAEIRVICQQERIRVWVDHVMLIDETDSTHIAAVRAGLFSRSTAVAKYSDFYAQLLSEVA